MKRTRIDLVCGECKKTFAPKDTIEYYLLKTDDVKLICPECIEAEKKNWTLSDIEFFNLNMGRGMNRPVVSFSLANGRRYEQQPYCKLPSGEISIRSDKYGNVGSQTQIPDEHVSEQLQVALEKHYEEIRRWKANIAFEETFDGSKVCIDCPAIGNQEVKFKVNSSGEIILDPAKKLDSRITEQVLSAWAKHNK
jgi:hypothetical protein